MKLAVEQAVQNANRLIRAAEQQQVVDRRHQPGAFRGASIAIGGNHAAILGTDQCQALLVTQLSLRQAEDRPRSGDFGGSRALAAVLAMVGEHFPHTPVILDSKRGDIATSSHNYAREAFVSWQADAVTVAPYMGSDSVLPFIDFGTQGVYILNRTSNPGGKDLQNLLLETQHPLYLEVARQIASYNEKRGRVGAVVGATNLGELRAIAEFYRDERVPLLIPGVGSQGGSASEVIAILRSIGYPLELVRINSSSALTHPWKKGPAPANWRELCQRNLASLIEEAAL